MSDPADCRPICVKCSEPVEIKSIRDDGWIQLEPHRCKTGCMYHGGIYSPTCPGCIACNTEGKPESDGNG